MIQKLKKIPITTGVYWVEVPEADLYVLCGCPADSIKHLKKRGFVIAEEQDGVCFETGPNAILLSDVLMQNGEFSNLGEFPVLHMLYMQGMIVPKHPNNNGKKPMLLGCEKQVRAQMAYIYRGNYGLISEEEIRATGIESDLAHDMMRLKLKFSYGTIHPSEDFLDTMVIGSEPVEIQNGVLLYRVGFNRYEFRYGQESVQVDLNLGPDQYYPPPYDLGYQFIQREYFAVIHSGDGNGWDVERPSMGSILMFQGKFYLIDAGPNIIHSLSALGINLNEIAGIFHTHAHDDHFAGLPALLNSDHRVKYFATPLVRASVTKKLCALMSLPEEHFSHYFEIHDLDLNEWNMVEGMEVKPIFSPHPLETTIFMFRIFSEDGYHSYAHWADIAAFNILDGMVSEDLSVPGISSTWLAQIKKDYLLPADLKKVDVGGGPIHGNASDFANDPSPKVVLSHKSKDLAIWEKGIGSSAHFGMVDVLVPSRRDYVREYAKQYLETLFPSVGSNAKEILMNCPIMTFNPGEILLKHGTHPQHVYVLLTGTVEYIRLDDSSFSGLLLPGLPLGDNALLHNKPLLATYRAASYAQVLRIPKELYRHFVKSHGLMEYFVSALKIKAFLKKTWLFGSVMSFPILEDLVQSLDLQHFTEHQVILESGASNVSLYLIDQGEVQLFQDSHIVATLGVGEVFGEESYVFGKPNRYKVKAACGAKIYCISTPALLDIPVIHRKLVELTAKRMYLKN